MGTTVARATFEIDFGIAFRRDTVRLHITIARFFAMPDYTIPSLTFY